MGITVVTFDALNQALESSHVPMFSAILKSKYKLRCKYHRVRTQITQKRMHFSIQRNDLR